jgi:hypothetical protein
MATCNAVLREQGSCLIPRTCAVCKLGPCQRLAPLPVVSSPPLAPSHELAGTGYDPGAAGHELAGCRPAPCGGRVIIGFAALANSGKSVAARRLIEQHGFVRGKFAAALKDMLRTFLRHRGADAATIERMIEGDLKERPAALLNGKSPRHAMQTLGTEWGRNCIDSELWVDTEMDAVRGSPAVVFEDVRFPNEVAAIVRAGGFVVRIERPGAGASTPGHSSETGVADLPASLTIRNDGTLDTFLAAIDQLAVTLSWSAAARAG